jgi:hypothetical protein
MSPEQEQIVEAIADRKRAERITTVLDGAGAILVVAGVALWSIPVALVVAGLAVLLIAHPIPIRRSR